MKKKVKVLLERQRILKTYLTNLFTQRVLIEFTVNILYCAKQCIYPLFIEEMFTNNTLFFQSLITIKIRHLGNLRNTTFFR